jgi:hypothetical protein
MIGGMSHVDEVLPQAQHTFASAPGLSTTRY